ncbi:MAG: Ig-like domain-containing protein, partial [bacterium]
MNFALASTTGETFIKPAEIDQTIKPILRGVWQGNETYLIDKISGKLATDMTPEETKIEVAVPNIHSILYWVDKNDPLGPAPINPADDSQFTSWEFGVQNWLLTHPQASTNKPTAYDDIHIEANKPKITIISPLQNLEYGKDYRIGIMFSVVARFPVSRANFYLNNELVGTSDTTPFTLNFVPSSTNSFVIGTNELKVVVSDSVYNKGETVIPIKIK